MKKQIKAPSHSYLMKSYFKSRKFRDKIKSGVERLKIITQIVELREKFKLTQTELAERIGVSQPLIARIENDQTSNLSLETLVKIVEALNGIIEIKIRPSRKVA